MVASSSIPPHAGSEPLATLTADDAALIEAYFNHGRNPFALAKATNTPLHAILAWAAQPHIRAYIDLIAKDLAEGLKSAALQALRELLDKTQDPVEKRRCAQSILRGLNPPRPRAAPSPSNRMPAETRGRSRPPPNPFFPAPLPPDHPVHDADGTAAASADADDDAQLDRELDEELDHEDENYDRQVDEQLDRFAESIDPKLLADFASGKLTPADVLHALSNSGPRPPGPGP
jgi:hypothetical protein